MPRYWIIAPYESDSPDLFNKVWQFDLLNNLISIGWTRLGDISKLSREELSKLIASAYPEKPPGTKGLLTNMLWGFYHEIALGDFVIARRGRKTLAAVGTVIQTATYSPKRNPYIDHPHFLGVSWQESPRDKAFPNIVFPMHTLAPTSEEGARKILHDTPVIIDPEPLDEIEDPQAFVLEKYLEDFIVSNFRTIFKNDLEIYKDSEGNNGQQYDTEIGRIDILAVEPKSKSFVVIELKKGRPSDQVIGQVLRYMGWTKKNLCNEGQNVKGLIISRDSDLKLSYALEMIRDVDVRYYTVSFKLVESPSK